MNKRKIVVAGAGAVAALSLIGVGAGASFTDAASASQSVTAGSINLGMSADGGDFNKSVSFATPALITSAGTTFTRTLTVENFGTLPVHVNSYSVTTQGDLPMTVSTFGQNLTNGTNPLSGITLAPNTPMTVTLTFVVPPIGNEYEGHSKTFTITANGTD
jgi:predicted ribosomally synthesized peptide with SipW-like signal peptide